MTSAYDVIVVGARCAGSPTAMLLAIAERRDLADRFAGIYAQTVMPREYWGPLLGQPA